MTTTFSVLILSKVLLFYAVSIGSHPDHPAHSCKHIRDNGMLKQNGEYWIDPENSGNPLKVYCDMATDGGMFWKVLQW